MNISRFFTACAFAALCGCAPVMSYSRHTSLDGRFINSVQSNDWNTAEDLIKRGANIDAQNDRGETALYLAADRGNLEAVKFLAEHGANLNISDKDGQTPLARAELRAFMDVVQYLDQKGASINN